MLAPPEVKLSSLPGLTLPCSVSKEGLSPIRLPSRSCLNQAPDPQLIRAQLSSQARPCHNAVPILTRAQTAQTGVSSEEPGLAACRLQTGGDWLHSPFCLITSTWQFSARAPWAAVSTQTLNLPLQRASGATLLHTHHPEMPGPQTDLGPATSPVTQPPSRPRHRGRQLLLMILMPLQCIPPDRRSEYVWCRKARRESAGMEAET